MKWQMDEEVLIDDRRATDDCRNTHCGADDEPAAPDDDEEEARMSWEVGVEVVQISLQGACAGYKEACLATRMTRRRQHRSDASEQRNEARRRHRERRRREVGVNEKKKKEERAVRP